MKNQVGRIGAGLIFPIYLIAGSVNGARSY